MKRLSTFPLIIVATLLGSTLVFSDQIQPLLDIGEERQVTEQASQTKIDSMDDDTSLIVNEYKTVSKQIEGLRVYNAQMRMQIHLAERKERVAFAKAAIDNPTVSPAEGLRQVLETFNVEMEYGRKLDNYKDTIEIEGQQREVNVLRVGRLALVYQSADESLTGAWDNNIDEWVALDSSYRNPTRKGLRIANKLATVDMLELPIQNPEAVQ